LRPFFLPGGSQEPPGFLFAGPNIAMTVHRKNRIDQGTVYSNDADVCTKRIRHET